MAITNDTRVRNISDSDVKKLQKLSKIFRINTTTGVLLNLIPVYFDNQAKIKKLQSNNQKLERELSQALEELVDFKKKVGVMFKVEKDFNTKRSEVLNSLKE